MFTISGPKKVFLKILFDSDQNVDESFLEDLEEALSEFIMLPDGFIEQFRIHDLYVFIWKFNDHTGCSSANIGNFPSIKTIL